MKVLSQTSLVLCQKSESYCKNKGENNQDVTKWVLVFDGFDKKETLYFCLADIVNSLMHILTKKSIPVVSMFHIRSGSIIISGFFCCLLFADSKVDKIWTNLILLDDNLWVTENYDKIWVSKM